MSGRTSRSKGAAGEREAAACISDIFGCTSSRGRQYHGGTDSPDVNIGIDGIHIEVKRVEALSLYKALDQSRNDAGDKIPLVMHRKNRQPWVFIVEAHRLMDLVGLLHKEVIEKGVVTQ